MFETVSRLSSSSHLIKGKLAPMVLPLDIPWCPVFLGIGIDPSKDTKVSMPLACDLGNPKPSS